MIRYVMVLACCVGSAALHAEQYPRPSPQDETATERLLRVQSSGAQASRHLQVQTARERDQSMQRWLDTYKYEIPDFYRWTKMTERNN
ncbi:MULTISPECIES: DUF3613 domain-containing protein [Pseudomonas]|uniref:DUF3613 domain-containing protein n=1 Tax=Pseudomonas juntendi TaxID=2666183 RepID=A0A7W2LPU7_9PSED|nr:MULTISPECIES: DUF3613 domain-containing protein [Pseudomonas]NOY03362.1 DUF3613 domain-containing protein [Gammaproteobacteria bacterium]OAK59082.1 hypothetical protein A3K88_21020 [Pseudomonas putida]PPB18007.1 DUF3613 domain-containing protein [Pseudomonas aeruginosa]MBA6144843.1 DUF3613 domain-containing protein [Pseudomonas juntendi]MCL8329923.1 DUF3613 domain-containing protein [Pseudomonas juntendi]